LGRLLIIGKLSENAYDQLREEWREKVRGAERILTDVERESALHLDDLDAALLLLSTASSLYPRLPKKQRRSILQILAKRLIVNQLGEIVGYELNKPFAYLHRITGGNIPIKNISGGSDQVRLGAQGSGAPPKRRSSPIYGELLGEEGFESSQVVPPITDVAAFFAGLRLFPGPTLRVLKQIIGFSRQYRIKKLLDSRV
jgi:hypothetical protein